MIFKLTLIALFSYLGAIGAPFILGTTGGFYTLGRPLVASAIVGLILGDMQTALEVGVMIQAMYIGIITPGAIMPFDVDYIGYLTPALIILSKMDPKLAPTLAVPVGLLGVFLWVNVIWIANVYFAHRADKYAEEGSMQGVISMNILPQILNFVVRFGAAFIVLYYGKDFLQGMLDSIPEFVTHYLGVVGGMLPALGIGLLLNMIIKEKSYLGLFLVGFVLAVYLKLSIIAIAILAGVLAIFWYKMSSGGGKFDGGQKIVS